MKGLILFVSILFSISCIGQSVETVKVTDAATDCGSYIYERLDAYFTSNEITARQIINNTHSGVRRSKTQKIRIGDHIVEWIDHIGDKPGSDRSSIKINGHLITLNDKKSLNDADGQNKLDLKLIGKWDQIKLYQLYEQDIIAVTMSPWMCTGLMCGVGAQMFYDAKTKHATFFGAYRTNFEAKLYDFADGNSFTVATNFAGDPHGVTNPMVITYELHKLQPNGQFQIQKNDIGQNYFIRHTIFPDTEIEEDKGKNDNGERPGRLEQDWIRPIK
ncbi:MAG: hypothetical protein KF685_06265 [Acidobacteria bacterium]|nr:hypothetical protein [Acidobacteriota bacterium]